MKALVSYAEGHEKLELRDVPVPKAGPGEVVIAVETAGICGSDLHIDAGHAPLPMRLPVVIGHEFSGTISEVGEGVTGLSPGVRVTSETAYAFCGECPSCRTGYYNYCPERRTLGYWYDGAFAERTKVPAGRVHPLPDGVDFGAAAMAEPLACVTLGAMLMTPVSQTDTVLVTGPGGIGLLALQVARAAGARVIVTGLARDHRRLDAALEVGADLAIDVESEDALEAVRERTGGRGVDVVLECSGSGDAVRLGLEALRRRGRFTQIGVLGRAIDVDLDLVSYKGLRVTGSLGSIWSSWQAALQLLEEGKVVTAPLISETIPLAQWRRAFNMAKNKEGIKFLLRP